MRRHSIPPCITSSPPPPCLQPIGRSERRGPWRSCSRLRGAALTTSSLRDLRHLFGGESSYLVLCSIRNERAATLRAHRRLLRRQKETLRFPTTRPKVRVVLVVFLGSRGDVFVLVKNAWFSCVRVCACVLVCVPARLGEGAVYDLKIQSDRTSRRLPPQLLPWIIRCLRSHLPLEPGALGRELRARSGVSPTR